MRFPQWLTLMFVYLKLTEQIDWSWWWVLSPIWILFLVIVLFACFGVDLTEKWKK